MTEREYSAILYCVAKVIAARDMYKKAQKEAEESYKRMEKLACLLVLGAPVDEEKLDILEKLEMSVHRAGFSVRIANMLSRNGIMTVGDVYQIDSYERLFRIRNLGVKYLGELIIRMRELGFADWAEGIESGIDNYKR